MQKVDGGHSLAAKGCDTDERGETVTSQPKRDECTRHTTLKMRRHKHAILSGRNEHESSDGGGGVAALTAWLNTRRARGEIMRLFLVRLYFCYNRNTTYVLKA